MRDQSIKRARKGPSKHMFMVRKLKNRVNDKATNPMVVKSKAATVVMSLAKVSRPNIFTRRNRKRIRCHQFCWQD